MGRHKKEIIPNCKCYICGKEFYRPISQIRDINTICCSKSCCNKRLKTMMLGENNPNYNNKWNDDLKKKVSNIVKERYKLHPELKEKCAVNKGKKLPLTSIKLKEYYKTHEANMKGKHHNQESLQKISKKSKAKFNEEYNKKIRKKFEDKGLWKPLSEKESIEIYYKESNWKKRMFDIIDDEEQIKLLKENGVFNSKNNSKGMVRDHMYSRMSGFENGVFPEILRHPCNCQIILHSNNIKKGKKNMLTLDELFDRIINYNKEWFEQEKVLKLIEEYKNGKRWFNQYRKE